MINNKMKKHLIGFEPTGERLCKIRFKGRFRNITILSAYAPTEGKDDAEKEFYDLLSKTCDQVPKYGMLIIVGDFNAKIGRENYTAQFAGKYTIHNETSAKGNLLVQFAEMNNLILKSICFDHKIIHEGTWKPPGWEGINHINQIIFSCPLYMLYL
jgi:exonuclease III